MQPYTVVGIWVTKRSAEAFSVTAAWLCPDTTLSNVTTPSQGDNLTQRQEVWTTDERCSNALKIKADISDRKHLIASDTAQEKSQISLCFRAQTWNF